MRGSASLFPMRRRGRQAWLIISRAQSILDNMHCPFCQNPDTKVVDTRISDDGHSIRRRRMPEMPKRFTTLETTMLLVVKRSGNVEQFDRNKVISGVRKACQAVPSTRTI